MEACPNFHWRLETELHLTHCTKLHLVSTIGVSLTLHAVFLFATRGNINSCHFVQQWPQDNVFSLIFITKFWLSHMDKYASHQTRNSLHIYRFARTQNLVFVVVDLVCALHISKISKVKLVPFRGASCKIRVPHKCFVNRRESKCFLFKRCSILHNKCTLLADRQHVPIPDHSDPNSRSHLRCKIQLGTTILLVCFLCFFFRLYLIGF